MSHESSEIRDFCVECGSRSVAEAIVSHTTQIRYEGKLHEVAVPDLVVLQCASCAAIFLDNRADEQNRHALRRKLGLLHPKEIKTRRESHGLTQVQLSRRIGIAAESLSRWENGHLIQSRAHDKLLRAYFDAPELPAFAVELQEVGQWQVFWYTVGSDYGNVEIIPAQVSVIVQQDHIASTDSPLDLAA